MVFLVKLLVTNAIVLLCTQIGRKFPSLGGLIATMPLTGALVLVWLYLDHPNDDKRIIDYTKGSLWGIAPSILFFVVAYLCFLKHLSFVLVLCLGFCVWLIGASIHQWVLD
jgi:uncharacterized membrane protein (GlpM family)